MTRTERSWKDGKKSNMADCRHDMAHRTMKVMTPRVSWVASRSRAFDLTHPGRKRGYGGLATINNDTREMFLLVLLTEEKTVSTTVRSIDL